MSGHKMQQAETPGEEMQAGHNYVENNNIAAFTVIAWVPNIDVLFLLFGLTFSIIWCSLSQKMPEKLFCHVLCTQVSLFLKFK